MDVAVRNGAVMEVRPAGRGRADAGSPDAVIAPPLFDIQVNGVAGTDLQDPALDADRVAEMTERLAGMGVAQWVPTLVTAAQDAMEHACRVIAGATADARVARAVPGIHLEGPHISPEDGPRGAHPRAHVRPPDLAAFDRLRKASRNSILYATLAPELPGAAAFIRGLRRRGVLAAIGHHNASAEQIAAAADAGARLSTHLGNGSAPLMPRHANPLWPQLADDRLAASLIADGHHLPDAMLKTFVRAKGPGRVVLVSDCVHLLGMPPGGYEIFGGAVDLLPNGKVCLRGTQLLAGSAVPLLAGVAHAARTTDLAMAGALAGASTVPARLLGARRRYALPEAGRKADFIVFTDRGGAMPRLDAVFIRGERKTPGGL